MAEPLSIASGIAGLLALAGKLTVWIGDFISNAKDAPSLAARLILEIEGLRAILREVQAIVDGTREVARLEMLQLSDLVLIVTGCMCAFSELEKYLLQGTAHADIADRKSAVVGIYKIPESVVMTPLRRMRWAAAEGKIKGIVEDLQQHKTSLSLMLMVINCRKNDEAMLEVQKLRLVVEEIASSQRETSVRMRELIARGGPPTLERDDEISVFSLTSVMTTSRRSFERVLRRTRVYRHNHIWNGSMFSLGSSVMRGTRWSAMSDLSLGEVSNIAVVDLPIWVDDIYSSDYYTAPPSENDLSAASGQLALLSAALQGEHEKVEELLKNGVKIDCSDSLGFTPLHWASQYGHIEVVKLLLAEGADPNAANPVDGIRPLHLAATNRHASITKLILDHGAEVDAKQASGSTALWLAVSAPAAKGGGHDELAKCVKELVSRGADVDSRGVEKMSPLHRAAWKGDADIVQLLLELGAQANARDTRLRTAKDLAVKFKYPDVIDALQEHQAKLKLV